jgi:hypothetical protein
VNENSFQIVTVPVLNATIPVITARSLTGQFDAVSVLTTGTILPSCPSVATSTSYTGLSVLVIVTVPECAGATPPSVVLSPGAIAGIVVGCLVLAAIVTLVSIYVFRIQSTRRDKAHNSELQKKDTERTLAAAAVVQL